MTIPIFNSARSKPSHATDFFRFAAKLVFAATVVFIPFRWRLVILERPNPPLYADYTDFMLFASDIFMLASLALWGLSLLIRRRKILLGPVHIWVPLFGLTLTGWFSLGASWDMPLTFYHATRFSVLFLFFLLIVNEIRSFAWVLIPVALQILIQSVVAIGQSLTQHDLGLQSFGEFALDPLQAGTSVLESGGTRFLRAYGLSDHPNILGGCLAFGLLILLAAFVYHVQNKEYVTSWLIAFAIIPASVALFLTFSRSAWIAFLIGSLFILGVESWRKNFAVLRRVAILALVCFVAVAPFMYRDRFYLSARFNADNSFSENRVEFGSIAQRIYLVDSANRIFVDHALTGVGLGVSALAMKQTYPIFPMNYQPPHLVFLDAALETGIFGAAFFFILIANPLLLLVVQRRLYTNKILIASASILLAILIVGLFDYYTWEYTSGRIWQWLAWGLWASAWNHQYAMD